MKLFFSFPFAKLNKIGKRQFSFQRSHLLIYDERCSLAGNRSAWGERIEVFGYLFGGVLMPLFLPLWIQN